MTAETAAGRLLGHLRGAPGGPLLLVIAGIHGNEPAGIEAARRMLARLAAPSTPLHGELLILLGNLGALREQRRYVQRDLNRGWTEANLAELARLRLPRVGDDEAESVAPGAPGSRAVSAPPAALEAEDREQLELLAAIEPVLDGARPVFVLDLHTSSADGFAFSIAADSPGSADFALAMRLPALRGILQHLDGTLAGYLGRRGCTALVVEGGQSADSRSVDRLESVLISALEFTGLLENAALPDLSQHREQLRAGSRGLPAVIEIHHRHARGPDDDFRMEPGFANLQRVAAGTLLARDRTGELRAPQDGWLIFPLYQSQGDDGFFLGRELPR